MENWDSRDHVWVTDTGNNRVQKWVTASYVTTYSSSFGSTGSENAQFQHPADIAPDSHGNLWVVDQNNSRVEKFNERGEYLSRFGSYGTSNGQFGRPTALAIDSHGNIWVTDAGNNRVEEFNEKGEYLSKFGSGGSGNGQFSGPEGIAVDSHGNIWVSDTYHGRLEEFNEQGEFIRVVSSYGSGQGQLGEPTGVDIGPGGNVWVADWQNNRVAEFTEAGAFVRQFGTEGTGNSQFKRPDAMAVDSKGNVWVGDQNNDRIQEFNQNGEYVAQFGSNGAGAGQFSFGWPMGVGTSSSYEWATASVPGPSQVPNAHLDGVSCTSATACTAVGSYRNGAGATVTLVERWNGSEWSVQSSPNPSGATYSNLEGVSCTSSTACTAVGNYEAGESLPLVESWNGTQWTVATTPSPSQVPNAHLDGVSCTSSTACTAVGSYRNGAGATVTLVERWNGSEWSVSQTPNPAGATERHLESVSCTSTTACTAVGSYEAAPSEELPLVESWDGTEWAAQPVHARNGSTIAPLQGVGCSGAFECLSVGSDNTTSSTRALIEDEAPGEGSHTITVEAVDKFGNAESQRIEVNAPAEIGETPDCSTNISSVSPQGTVTSAEAIADLQKTIPEAVEESKSTTDTRTEEEISPSYTAPKPNLENIGNLAEGETSVTPNGGFTLKGIACVTPAETTGAATDATVVHGDAAVFANTAPETSTAIRPTTGGTALVELLDPGAPSTFAWNITLNPGETISQLPSGAVVITNTTAEEEATGEVTSLVEPKGSRTPAELNDAQVQLEGSEYQLAAAEAATNEEVLAVISKPWAVLSTGGIVPVKIEVVPDTEVPTEYQIVETMPGPGEPGGEPGEELEFLMGVSATASVVVNAHCGKHQSPCGNFRVNKAAHYAEWWGDPNHGRNHEFWDYKGPNCTNFVSQILVRGQMSLMRAYEGGHGQDGSWWYRKWENPLGDILYSDTDSWRQADVLPRHLWQYGLAAIDGSSQPSGWGKGDIMAEDFYPVHGKGGLDHLQFVVGRRTNTDTGIREPLIAQESGEGSKTNYSHLPWIFVKQHIDEDYGREWTRVPLEVVHTTANYGEKGAKKHAPENLYG